VSTSQSHAIARGWKEAWLGALVELCAIYPDCEMLPLGLLLIARVWGMGQFAGLHKLGSLGQAILLIPALTRLSLIDRWLVRVGI
jgi:hypothetical protein